MAKQSLLFISRDPVVWVSYTLLMGVLLVIGRISVALGIFSRKLLNTYLIVNNDSRLTL